MDTTVLGHNTARNMQDDSVFRRKQIICTVHCTVYTVSFTTVKDNVIFDIFPMSLF